MGVVSVGPMLALCSSAVHSVRGCMCAMEDVRLVFAKHYTKIITRRGKIHQSKRCLSISLPDILPSDHATCITIMQYTQLMADIILSSKVWLNYHSTNYFLSA